MKEYKLPLDSFIGGWFLSTKVCDKLISYYNEFSKHATPGKSGNGKVRKNIKDSLDLSINSKNFDKEILIYREKVVTYCNYSRNEKNKFPKRGKKSTFN